MEQEEDNDNDNNAAPIPHPSSLATTTTTTNPHLLLLLLLSFRAGRVAWDGRLATPDTRRGRVCLERGGGVGTFKFYWEERTDDDDDNNNNDSSRPSRRQRRRADQLTLVGDAWLERIIIHPTGTGGGNIHSTTPPSGEGRVYVLRLRGSDKKLLYWSQELHENNDQRFLKQFNSIMTKSTNTVALNQQPGLPHLRGPARHHRGLSGGEFTIISDNNDDDDDDEEEEEEAEQDAPTGTGGTTTTAATTTTTTLPANLFTNLLTTTRRGMGHMLRPIPLSALFTPARLSALLHDPLAFAELRDHLPPSPGTPEAAKTTRTPGTGDHHDDMMDGLVHSPQLSSALGQLTQAIYSDQLPVLQTSLGLPACQPDSGQDPLEILVAALEDALLHEGGTSDDDHHHACTTTGSQEEGE